MPRIAPVLVVCLLAFAGCGGGGDKPDRFSLTTPKTSPEPSAPPGSSSAGSGLRSRAEPLGRTGPVTRREKAVVRGWSDALRHGDLDGAVSYWAVPATAWNGDPSPVRLLTRSAIRVWNASLPCGAKLEKVERDSNYVLATFRLTERAGQERCDGVGHRVRTLFLLRRERRIVQWLRATDPPSGDAS